MSDKIKHFPRGIERRERLNRRQYKVPCQISERWLQFPLEASPLAGGDFMHVDVMTLGIDENPRKICELVLTKQDLLAVLNQVVTKYE